MSPKRGFRPDIEGLRAVAILLVVAYHAAVPGFSGGYIGVDVFFVVSGYLITGLLLHELEKSGTLDLKRFYARRARRLLPAAALVLVATLAAGRVFLSPLELRDLSDSALATSVYASNVHFMRLATDYLAADSHDNPLLHTWSLAVEEQFYLVWPLLLLGAWILAKRLRGRGAIVAPLAVVTVLSFACSVVLTRVLQPWAFFGSPFRAWEFGVGGLAALIPASRLPGGPRARVAAATGLVLVLGPGMLYSSGTAFPGLAALPVVLGTTLMLVGCARAPGNGIGRVLGLRPFQRIGALSYSWYLWHWPVLVFAADERLAASLSLRVGWALFALLLSEATFRLVEDPVRHHRALRSRPARTAAVASALMLVSIGCSGLARARAARAADRPDQRAFTSAWETLPENYRRGCHVEVLAVEGPLCAFGDSTAATTVVLFGDSHAAQWLPALDRIGRRRGWRIVPLTKSECPAADVSIFSTRLGRTYDECDRWRDRTLERIRSLDPALVFAASSHAYPADGAGLPFRIGFDDWRHGLARTLEKLADGGARVLLVRDTPRPGFVVPVCLSRAGFALVSRRRGCSVARATAVDTRVAALERDVAAERRVGFIDLTDAICGPARCPPTRADIVVYKDSNHLSAAYSAHLAGPLERALEEGLDFDVPAIEQAGGLR